jgi:hypothetical protein
MIRASILMVKCPDTGCELSTGIEIRPASRYSVTREVSGLRSRSHSVHARCLAWQPRAFRAGVHVVVYQQPQSAQRLRRGAFDWRP